MLSTRGASHESNNSWSQARSHVRALVQRMRVVLVHTRYADSIEAMVAEHGALTCLWWSRDAVLANFEACLANSGESVLHCMWLYW